MSWLYELGLQQKLEMRVELNMVLCCSWQWPHGSCPHSSALHVHVLLKSYWPSWQLLRPPFHSFRNFILLLLIVMSVLLFLLNKVEHLLSQRSWNKTAAVSAASKC